MITLLSGPIQGTIPRGCWGGSCRSCGLVWAWEKNGQRRCSDFLQRPSCPDCKGLLGNVVIDGKYSYYIVARTDVGLS